ncbi:hypothetical protein [Sphaerisporangium perillae]|uniref:hypothetical protein n=1 Tax=Sphaerisporangium perillae TaxID=2935860 RepID=UPI00200E6131|nr:hypothetical protein [Sphaerisporangium perillae]
MPVPVSGLTTGDRPSGSVAPAVELSGPTELRVHGVGGSTPQNLLADLAPQQVAGDDIAGFYRTADARGRHVEGYSWGGLTSRSGSRVLWLLLLPFALANLAGWMWPFQNRSSLRFRVFRESVRLAALGVTVNVVLLVSVIPMDYVAYQCGGNATCAAPWWMGPLRMPGIGDHPGRRVALGAVVPLLVVVLLAVLSLLSRRRYEDVRPPGTPGPREECARNAAALPGGLTDPDFWNTGRYTRHLSEIHIAVAFALLAIVLTHTVHTTFAVRPDLVVADGARLAPEPLYGLSLGCAGVVVVVAIAALAPEKVTGPLVHLGRVLIGLAVLALVLAVVFAWLEPQAIRAEGALSHELPGMRYAMNAVYLGIVVALLLVPVWLLAASFTRETWPRRSAQLLGVGLAATVVYVTLGIVDWPYGWIVIALVSAAAVFAIGARHHYRGFRWGAPFIVLSVAVLMVNTFLVGLLVRVADTIGEIGFGQQVKPLINGAPSIAVFPIMGEVGAYLIFEPLALVLLFAGWQAVLWYQAGGSGAAAEVADEYRGPAPTPAPATEPHTTNPGTTRPDVDGVGPVTARPDVATPDDPDAAWVVDVVSLTDAVAKGTLSSRWATQDVLGWAAGVGRARRLAKATLDLDLLFSAVVLVGIILFAWLEQHIWSGVNRPTPWLAGVGTLVATLLPFLVVIVARAGWKDRDTRRVIGALWDVGTFWPRGYHPLAPPAYAERAVPELQRRMWYLHDHGARVVLTAHSQGAILAAAALSQHGDLRPKNARIVLVTFGSPLRKLYGWGFPAYFNEELFTGLRRSPHIHAWRNFYYLTDYIGGWTVTEGVTVKAQEAASEDGTVIDWRLPDPPTSRFVYGDPPPPIGSHSGYWNDRRMWTEVDALVARHLPRSDGGPPGNQPAAREDQEVSPED